MLTLNNPLAYLNTPARVPCNLYAQVGFKGPRPAILAQTIMTKRDCNISTLFKLRMLLKYLNFPRQATVDFEN